MSKKMTLPLTAVLAFGMFACGGEEETSGEEGNNNPIAECTAAADCAGRADGKTECDTANNVCVAPENGEEPGAVTPPTGNGAMKISQVYFGGYPDIGTKYQTSYVELFNAGGAEVDLKEYSIVYGTTVVKKIVSLYNFCGNDNCIVPAGGYFLMKIKPLEGTPGNAVDADIDLNGIPSIGQDGVLGIGQISGLSGSEADCETLKAAVKDLVGMGANTWCNEGGSGNATGLTNDGTPENSNRSTHAYYRKGDGCIDTDNNANDFEVREASPRNSGAAPHVCGVE